jgi:adenosine deaminase
MFNCFEVFLPLITGNLQLIEQLAFDFCQRQYEQNCVYCEVRYSPHLLAEGFGSGESAHWDTSDSKNHPLKQTVTAEAVFLAVRKGLRRGCEHFTSLRVNQIFCAINWRPDWAISTLELAVKYFQDDGLCGVVGIDIAAGEEHFDSEKFPTLHETHYRMAQMAREHQIPLTIHAGEAGNHALENVRKAVTEYGAVRVGHGYRMVDSVAVMKLVQEMGVHVEICPTSSDETGGWVYSLEEGGRNWKKHPTVTMMKHGISVSLSSDDPAVFHTSLAWQYRIALAKMELSQQELLQLNLNAIEAAWCSERDKKTLRRLIRFYGMSQSIDLFAEDALHVDDDNVHSPHTWSRSKTDSFLDRVYINSDWQV